MTPDQHDPRELADRPIAVGRLRVLYKTRLNFIEAEIDPTPSEFSRG
jgi:hypothetical protein